MLEARGLEFAYGSVQVLFGVDLRVDTGEIVALVGTNGAGKSTVLDLLAGLVSPSAGAITLDGEDVTGIDAVGMVERGVALVQGGRAVFPDLSVIDNLRVGLPARRLGPAGVRRRARELLDRFPSLHGLADRQAGTLSAGEQQQVGLAKGLLLDPRILLVDELTLGLAPEARTAVVALVQEVHASGTTVVLVEQDLDVALGLARRAAFLEKGTVVFDGEPDELRGRDDLLRAVFLGVSRA